MQNINIRIKGRQLTENTEAKRQPPLAQIFYFMFFKETLEEKIYNSKGYIQH